MTQALDETQGTTHYDDETVRTDMSHNHDQYDQDESMLDDNGDISGSTPRRPQPNQTTEFQPYDSPYEALKREMKPQWKYKSNPTTDDEDDIDMLDLPPVTPGTNHRLPRMSMALESSPFGQTSYLPSAKRNDPLLHRVMDKNYRVHATPHTAQKEKAKTPVQQKSWRDLGSPGSSSPIQAPTLHHEFFSSPIRQPALTPRNVASSRKQNIFSKLNAPRTPGVSVQTPAEKPRHDIASPSKTREEITWESDSDEDEDIYKTLGMSPPKTIQFALPPSRLVQTPARDVSTRIVQDIMGAAGGQGYTDDEDSPSMVRPSAKSAFDDTF